MKDRCFIDTNIWVYAHLYTENNKKSDIALTLLESSPLLVTSTQVLNEYYSVLLKKKIADAHIQDNIEVMLDISDIHIIQVTTLYLTHKIKLKYGFSYWDSLIVASALEASCPILYSEDMQHQQVIEKSLTIINPFK
ncbi:PIN domain-containing protein [Methylovulum psychrotolerans]|uniref:PIN domain-containing protein n=1 Tax=Methylovulum psychrotolerans TaxID=1704499 RepID=UPI001BFF0CD6|nr:PIN domain-containing protein [Methylovulum psychrotolerans]MBT9097124.1 PIN domain-containing protein [Methylovulum psychrotolerans]